VAYALSKEEFIKLLPSATKREFLFVNKMDDNFFATNAPLKAGKIFDIKTSKNNIDLLNKNIETTSNGLNYDFIIDGFKFRFILSGKSSSRVGDAKTTQYQELGSVYVAQQVYNSKDVETSELVKLYADLPNQPSWQVSYKAQEKVFKQIFTKHSQFRGSMVFNRDGGFMDWITAKAKTFGFSRKDAWNPADMWVHTKDVHKKLEDCITVYELNNKMLELFKSGDLMGISLKQTDKIAKYEETNFTKIKQKSNKFISGKLLLNTKKGKNEFINDEFSYDLQHPEGIINVQVRMFPKKPRASVQVSYKLKGGKAEMGKVPAAIRNIVYNDYVKAPFPTGRSVPSDLKSYNKRANDYKKMIPLLIRKYDTGIKDFSEFNNNVLSLYKDERYSTIELVTKFQGIELAYQFAKLSDKELTELVTKWAYAAQKKGEENGPFIKVY